MVAMELTKKCRYGPSRGQMVFSPAGLGARGIETAEDSSEFSIVALSDIVIAREFFRNLDIEAFPSLCFLDCVRGPNVVTSTIDWLYVIELLLVLDESVYPPPQ